MHFVDSNVGGRMLEPRYFLCLPGTHVIPTFFPHEPSIMHYRSLPTACEVIVPILDGSSAPTVSSLSVLSWPGSRLVISRPTVTLGTFYQE